MEPRVDAERNDHDRDRQQRPRDHNAEIGRSFDLSIDLSMFAHRVKIVGAGPEYDVIVHFDFQDFARFNNPVSQGHVIHAWGRVTGWVIVIEDNRGRVVRDGGPKDFTGRNRALRQSAMRYLDLSDQLAADIEQQNAYVLAPVIWDDCA
jgi:hypothetical protein